MSKNSPRWAFLSWALFACLSQSAESSESFSLAGRAVNSITGEPVKRALVMLNHFGPISQGVEGGMRSERVLADEAGMFRFTGLPAGRYHVAAKKPQFVAELGDSDITLGPSRENVEVKLKPLATIEGSVLDMAGSPLQGIGVQVIQSSILRGLRQFNDERPVSTDDQGHYRIWNLSPGTYYLRVGGRGGGTRQYLEENAVRTVWPEAVASVYYGGATNRLSASPVTLTAGQHLTADFNVPLVPAFKILGKITNYAPYRKVTVQLLSSDGQAASNRVAVNAVTGRFEVSDVTPGEYRLRAGQGEGDEQTRAELEIRVASGNLAGVNLPLEPGLNIRVLTQCDHASESQPHEACFAALSLRDRTGGSGKESEYQPGRGLLFKRVFPGAHRLTAHPLDDYIAAATVGGVDLMPSGMLELLPGIDPGPIELSIRSDGGAAEVTVELEKRPTGLAILLVPEFPTISEAILRTINEGNTMLVEQLAPGDYTAYALSNPDEIAYSEPDVRRSFANGVKVRVTPRGHEQVKITGLAQ